MRWFGHVTYMGTGNADKRFSLENLRERGHLEELAVDGRKY
jgi:hypothetical protein